MADKKTESKTKSSTKPSPAAKPASKPTTTAKSTTSAKPAAKPVATVKPKAAASPAAKADVQTKAAQSTKSTVTTAQKATNKTTAADAKSANKSTAANSTAPKRTTTAAKTTDTAASKPAVKAQSDKPIAAGTATVPKNTTKTAAAVKPDKSKKQSGTKAAKKSGGSSKAKSTVALSPKNIRIIISSAVAFVLIIAIVIGIVVGTKSCKNNSPFSNDGPPEVLGATSVSGDKPASKDTVLLNPIDSDDEDLSKIDGYQYEYSNSTPIGYYAEVKGKYKRVKPVEDVKDERDYFDLGITVDADARYPKFGSTMNSVVGNDPDGKKATARGKLINESSYLTATGTWNAGGGGYTWMNENGLLYSGTRADATPTIGKDGVTQRQLYKHTAAEGLYGGNVSDDQDGIIKEITIRPRGYTRGYGITGLYAPAGEVIKIEMSEADMDRTAGITIHIGQALYNGKANNIWVQKGQMQRIPHLLNTMQMTKDTSYYDEANHKYICYVGSFIGGPIYIRNESVAFTATISGGVPYAHFILGYTTEEEYLENAESTAPYFDMEVWTYGVLHSGPKRQAMVNGQIRSYDDIYKAAVLWEKVSSVTTTGNNQGIVFLYEPFVAAGAAVAFPGQGSVNCPEGWMKDSLNYNGLVTSGSWGNFHEYHHNFQGYGVGNGGEVTNNAMTLVSYALFTKISSKRGIGNFGAQGLGGWNDYTSATWALNDVLKISQGGSPSNGKQGLALYATLLHNFGADRFIQAKVAGGGQSYQAYMNAWQQVTHNNMSYYFNDILNSEVSDNADKSYPMFVPVSCVYQTGRSYVYDGEKKYFKTMQPYVIPFGTDFNIDLSRYNSPNGQYASGSIVIPDGFTYRIKSVTKPAEGHGTIEIVDNYNLKYKPSASNTSSGQIIVTLEIAKNDGAFKVNDVDLVLEFEQSHETNKMTLERTTYTYSADKMYSDAVAAYNANFAGAESTVEKWNHSNPTQNANTDIWFYPDNEENREKYPNAPESYFIHDNTIEVIDGKLYIEDFGKYRVYLRGRTNAALYYSVDGGTNYALGARINDDNRTANFRPTDSNTYFDIEFKENELTNAIEVYVNDKLVNSNYIDKDGVKWINIKEVLIVSSESKSFIGVGMTQWTQTMFTISEKHYKEDKTEVDGTAAEGYKYTETTYSDYRGNAVAVVVKDKDSAEASYYKIVNGNRVASTQDEVSELTETKLIAPTSAAYVNAYRSSYKFPDNTSWESDYFYIRSYNYNYVDSKTTNYSTWDNDTAIVDSNFVPENSNYTVDKILEVGDTTFMHPAKNGGNNVYITIDMGKEISANSVTFIGRGESTNASTSSSWQGFPKQFNLEVSSDNQTYSSAGNYTNGVGSGAYRATVNLDKTYTFRYVKINITNTHSNTGRLILSGIEFSHTLRLTGNGANHISTDNKNIVFTDGANGKGSWKTEIAYSTFGRIHVGGEGDKVKFNFTGTRLAILNPTAYENNFEVYIDGKKVNSIEVNPVTDAYGITYVSEKLTSGKHSVEIRCTGKTAFDSFAIYNETD